MNAIQQWTGVLMGLSVALAVTGCTNWREERRLIERAALKQEIMEELRAEFAAKNPFPPDSAPSRTLEQAASVTQRAAPPPSSPPGGATTTSPRGVRYGSVRGQLLDGGQGLESVLVRLVRMEAFASRRSGDYRNDDYYDAKTDRNGGYFFPFVEPGKYKLLWVPTNSDSWVRRLADRPDVVVEDEQVAVVAAIQTKRRLLGGE